MWRSLISDILAIAPVFDRRSAAELARSPHARYSALRNSRAEHTPGLMTELARSPHARYWKLRKSRAEQMPGILVTDARSPAVTSNLALLRLETDLVLAELARKPLPPDAVQVRIGIADDGAFVHFVGEIASDVRARIETVLERDLARGSEGAPSAVGRCIEVLLGDASGKIDVDPGPVYVLPPDAAFASDAVIVRSDRARSDSVRDLNPGNWLEQEWEELVRGDLGPWAMATLDGRVVSICHTPLPVTDDAAEAGVWTAPDARGRGYASAAVSAWCAMLRDSVRWLFYSTSSTNVSSIRVAERLGARLIGRTWEIIRVTGATK